MELLYFSRSYYLAFYIIHEGDVQTLKKSLFSLMLKLKKTHIVVQSEPIEIVYLVSTQLESHDIPHAFSTRKGGVSLFPQNSLNMSFREDEPKRVHENQKRFLQALQLQDKSILTAHQTHSDVSVILDSTFKPETKLNADALILEGSSVYLIGVNVADCLPILLAHPGKRIVCAIHAGWRGTAQRITEKTVLKLSQEFKINPAELIGAIGPGACRDCYEVGEEVREMFPDKKRQELIFKPSMRPKHYLLDLQKANLLQFEKTGIPAKNIDTDLYCTIHHNDLFFSHRKEGPQSKENKTGRFLGVIGVEN